jgi:hypothetical protein
MIRKLNSSLTSLIQELINLMSNINPEQYLSENDLSESLVIKMTYLQEKMEFHLIIDFAMTPEFITYLDTGAKPEVSPPRDFRRLVFSGTSDISISNIETKRGVDLIEYSIRDNPPLDLQNVELQQNRKRRISLYFGTYGTCSFNFDSLQVDRRLGRAVKAGDDFLYFDVDSGTEFDFYNPF